MARMRGVGSRCFLALSRTHDGYEQLIRGLSEIGQFDLAYRYSEKAMLALPTEDTFHIVTFWAALCDAHFPHRSPAVHRIAFDSFPMLSTARGLFCGRRGHRVSTHPDSPAG